MSSESITGLNWLRMRFSGGSCEHDNETLSSIKGVEFIGELINYYFLKKTSAPLS
jgi:hypothetical protein